MQRPKVRFKGFTDDWEQRKFGELVEKYEDIVDTPQKDIHDLELEAMQKEHFIVMLRKEKNLKPPKCLE